MVSISIGSTTDDRKKVTKTFTASASVSCAVSEPCDILAPSFLLTYNAAYLTCNYLYCPTFHRYYYIESMTVNKAGQIVLQCSCDVLMSYAASIKSLTATVIRNENANPGMQIDNEMVLTPKSELSFIKLQNSGVFNVRGTTSYNYVLCIAGGQAATP